MFVVVLASKASRGIRKAMAAHRISLASNGAIPAPFVPKSMFSGPELAVLRAVATALACQGLPWRALAGLVDLHRGRVCGGRWALVAGCRVLGAKANVTANA